MILLIIAILVAVPSESSDCGGKLTLNAEKPTVTFRTPNYPKRYNSNEKCTWVVSAPGNVDKFNVKCNISIARSPLCISGSFSIESMEEKEKFCGTKTLQMTLKGSTSLYKFKSSICSNLGFKGIDCIVSYNPEHILTETTPLTSNCQCGQRRGNRIEGGSVTKENEYPWQAMLFSIKSKKPFCGGSLIAKTWVLTAAHCTEKRDRTSFIVILGEHNWNAMDSKGKNYYVKEIINHEHFRQKARTNNDIALLELKVPVIFDEFISPICLPFNYKYYDFSDNIGIVTGWGLTNPANNKSVSDDLKQVKLNIIMPYKCLTLDGYGWTHKEVTENMICALGANEGTCSGDSGGPLVWMRSSGNLYFQIGILSLGPPNLNSYYPEIYTRVSQFVDWIVDKTKVGNEFCVRI